MTPDQLSAVNAVATIIEKLGTLPIGSLLLLMVGGPWAAMWVVTRGQEKRFETVVKMYEDNAKLVKCYEDMTKNFQDLVIYNTQAMTQVKEQINSNLYCPLVRKGTKQTEAGH
jgi:hypothetical protein